MARAHLLRGLAETHRAAAPSCVRHLTSAYMRRMRSIFISTRPVNPGADAGVNRNTQFMFAGDDTLRDDKAKGSGAGCDEPFLRDMCDVVLGEVGSRRHRFLRLRRDADEQARQDRSDA
jgi:hypothetical protein